MKKEAAPPNSQGLTKSMKVDISRIQSHIEALAAFTATPGAGATRLSYSLEYQQF